MLSVRRLICAPVTTALVLSLGAQCLAWQDMSAAQMACCAAIEHDCHAAAAAQDCCQTERGDQPQAAKQIQQLARPAAILTNTIPGLVRAPDLHSAFGMASVPLTTASPPKYVLLASFLI